jgi:hypothetical protein
VSVDLLGLHIDRVNAESEHVNSENSMSVSEEELDENSESKSEEELNESKDLDENTKSESDEEIDDLEISGVSNDDSESTNANKPSNQESEVKSPLGTKLQNLFF